MHRTDIGVEAGANVLDVEYQHIGVGHLFRSWFFVLAIKRDYGKPRLYVDAVFYDFTVGCVTAESVFRTENFRHLHTPLKERVDEVCFSNQGRVIYQKAYTFTVQHRQKEVKLVCKIGRAS